MIRRHLLLVLACVVAGAAAGASFSPLWPRYTLVHVAAAACLGQVLGLLVGLTLARQREADARAAARAAAPVLTPPPAVPPVPVLGVVPVRLPAPAGRAAEQRPATDPYGDLADQVAARTAPGRVLAVCSADPADSADSVDSADSADSAERDDGLLNELARALSAGGRRVVVVDGRTAASPAPVAAGAASAAQPGTGDPAPTPARLARSLRRAAASADLLLLATPPLSTPAGERLVGCADDVLLVATSGPDLEPRLRAARLAVTTSSTGVIGAVLVSR